MPKVWSVAEKASEDLLEQLLINRGIISKTAKEVYLNPALEYFKDSISIPGTVKAQERIKKAIKDEELIFIYGDYDVDGISASTVMYHGLTSIGAKVYPYIPHREREGYGLSEVGLNVAKEKKATLVISVDCGIVAFEQAKFAKKLGLDLIITDHHQPLADAQSKPRFPETFCLVHTTAMCGAAVAWCLLYGLIDSELSDDLLQFVAMATVCDMIPLTGVNRFFVKKGLEILSTTKNIGLKALLNECGILKAKLTTFDVGFLIGPRLNAIGRLEHAIDALRLLCTKDPVKARKLATLLCSANDQRKQLTLDGLNKARQLYKDQQTSPLVVINSKDFIPGIIGLIAGKISEEFGVSAIVISEGEAISKGSARAANGLNIVEAIRGQIDLLVDVGGHQGAAGFTIETSKIAQFKANLQNIDFGSMEVCDPLLKIDAQVSLKDVTKELISRINLLEPFGLDNPNVVLASKALKVDELRLVGDGKHIQLVVDGIKAIAFNMGDVYPLLKKGQLINLAYVPEIDNFNGNEKMQLRVKDIQTS